MRIERALLLALPTLLIASACGGAFHRMPDRPVMWSDPDRTPFAERPDERYVSWRFDAVDHLILRPATRVWAVPADEPAINVNAYDEVPSSSWFVNRIGRYPMSPADVARGACERLEPTTPRPWTVVAGKPDGTHPGLTIEDAEGVRYLLKTDGHLQRERATAADAIAAALYHAAGYHTPCNRVAYVSRQDLILGPGAEAERLDGSTRPITEADVDEVLDTAVRLTDGRHRVGLSRFIEGRPVGPWSYEGVLREDPNDVVPHERRRDLRGLYLLAAWTGHIDSRQENTLASWIEIGERGGYLRHYLIDFGDCFGVVHESDRMSRRFEHDHYLDLPNVLLDTITLGLIPRPWHDATHGPGGRTLGYYDVEGFDPSDWTPGYPNPAFDARTEHDSAWMARILSRFSREHVEAAVRAGRFTDPAVRDALADVLWGRRQRILGRYLTRLSPLAWPAPRAGRVCLQDLAVTGGLRSVERRSYEAWLVSTEPPSAAATLAAEAIGGRVCVRLPADRSYVAFDVVSRTEGRTPTLPLRVHAYADERSGRYRVAGLHRLSWRSEPPR